MHDDFKKVPQGVLEGDEAYKELMSLFEEKTYLERLRLMFAGLKEPHDTKEYKLARIEMQRLMAPVLAVLIPLVAVVLLVIFAKNSNKDEHIIITEVMQEVEEAPPLEEIEPPEPPDVVEDFTPVDVDFSPNVAMDTQVEAPAADNAPVSAQPQKYDTVLAIKSPVILRNIFGATRDAGTRGAALAKHGGNPKTEASVMRALRWLKATQNPDGSWRNNQVAMTGLAILTFLAHGEKPGDSAEFGDTVMRGMEYLMSCQAKFDGTINDGLYTTSGSGYAHAIATYAMCEAYGMTMNPNVQQSADRAVAWIIKGQHPSGGWDYNWKQSERDDTSVMGWAAQALKAAMMSNFYHDPEALERASKLSVKGFKKNGFREGGFGYTAPQKGGLTGVGTLCMQFHGAARDPYVRNSLENIIYNWKPEWVGSTPANPIKTGDKVEDLPPGVVGGSCPQYYYYYATQAVFQGGGNEWEKWNKRMWPSYVAAQFIVPKNDSGSVCKCGTPLCGKIKEPYVDAQGNAQEIGHWVNTDAHGDRPVMDTCLAALQMMVYYRYLPTFQKIDLPPEIEAATSDGGDITVESNL